MNQEKSKFNALFDYLNSFYPLDPALGIKFGALAQEKFLAKGDFLVRAGEGPAFCAYIFKGLFCSSLPTGRGKEIVKGLFLENQMIGPYAEFLSGTLSVCHYQALEDSEVLVFSLKELFQLVEETPDLVNHSRKFAEMAFLIKDQRETQLLLLDSAERYQEFLKFYPPDIHKRVAKHIIASYLGMRPETLSRVIKKFSQAP